MSRTLPFGLLLRQWRNQAGLSLRELGIAVGRTKGNLSRIERGHLPPPPVEILDKLAAALGVPNETLYEAAGQPSVGADQPTAAEEFGQAVQAWRNKAGLTQRQVQDATGIPAMRLSRIERGLVVPSDSDLDQLATPLGVPRAALYKAASRRPPTRGGRAVDAVDAIMADPILTAQEKGALVHLLILLRSRHARHREYRPQPAQRPAGRRRRRGG
jgi:transcriptional regulator with XRE-family HTH domain